MSEEATLPLAEPHELQLLRGSMRGSLAAAWPASHAVRLAEQPDAVAALWRTAAAQGWTGLSASDEEFGLAAALVAMQELGRASCPLPLLDAVLANAVLGASRARGAQHLMAALQAGQARVAWIFPQDGAAPDAGLQVSRTLEGEVRFVEHGAIATHFLLATGRPGEFGVILFSVPNIAP